MGCGCRGGVVGQFIEVEQAVFIPQTQVEILLDPEVLSLLLAALLIGVKPLLQFEVKAFKILPLLCSECSPCD